MQAPIDEAAIHAYTEEEQRTGFFTMLQDNLAIPFTTTVLGVEVTVHGIDLTPDDRTLCSRGSCGTPAWPGVRGCRP